VSGRRRWPRTAAAAPAATYRCGGGGGSGGGGGAHRLSSASLCVGGGVGGKWVGQVRLGHALTVRSCLHQGRWPAAEGGTLEGLVMNLFTELKHLSSIHCIL